MCFLSFFCSWSTVIDSDDIFHSLGSEVKSFRIVGGKGEEGFTESRTGVSLGLTVKSGVGCPDPDRRDTSQNQ